MMAHKFNGVLLASLMLAAGVCNAAVGRFSKNSPHAVLYKHGTSPGHIIWRDNQPLNFAPAEMKDLDDALRSEVPCMKTEAK